MEDRKIKRESKMWIIPIIIIFLLLIILIYLGFYAYSLKLKLEEIKNNIVSEENEENIVDYTIHEDEIGIELETNENIVKGLIKKIDFPTHVIASIYKTGNFNLRTIPNDLILRSGWANADKELTENSSKYNQSVTKEKIADSILDIFGRKLVYIDDSFTNIDVPTFHGYYENRGVISYSNGLYTANYKKGKGDSAFIHQEIDKVLQYSDRIEVIVKTAFIDNEYNGNTKSFDYIIYKNFNNDKFEEQLYKTTPKDFKSSYLNQNNEYTSFNSNSKILEIAKELNSFIYTFKIDSNNGDYYLSEFRKVE